MPNLGIIASSTRQGLSTTSYFSIATVTLTGTQNDISFSSISQDYTHLQIRYFGFSNSFGTQFMEINGDTNTSNYRTHYSWVSGATTSSGDLTGRAAILGGGFTGQFGTTYPMAGVIDILDYKNTNKIKVTRQVNGVNTNGTHYTGEFAWTSGSWNSTSAITSLRFYLDGGNTFRTGTKYAIYGIKVAS